MTEIRDLVLHIEPVDDAERQDRDQALAWLAATTDVFRRRSAPVEPARHLVSYFAVVDRDSGHVLLGDHRKSGLWLPSGGHVEPGGSPVVTVRRECHEELGIEATFLDLSGEAPLFITITETVGGGEVHTDVSLWFCLSARTTQDLRPDPREYRAVRWWTPDDIRSSDPTAFDPHMGRFLDKLEPLMAPLAHPAAPSRHTAP